MMDNDTACVKDVIKRGYYDWIQMAEVASVAIEIGGARSPDEIREQSMRIIRSLVEMGIMELGDIGDLDPRIEAGQFQRWSMSDRDSIARVETEWRALRRNPGLWEIGWLQLTPHGRAIAETLLK